MLFISSKCIILARSIGYESPPSMNHPSPFPLVEVSGTPRQRGHSYGEQARERIGRSVELYVASLRRMGCSQDDIERFIATFLPDTAGWAPDLIEEMEGIAAGAGIAYSSVVLVNARTEVLQLAKREKGIVDDEPDGCTGAIVLPASTRNGTVLHGQNWDWKAECAETSVVLRILRDDGPDILTFTEAGGLARSGFNAAGIAITANYLESDRDYTRLGIPLPFIRRRVLEAQHFAQALRVVAVTPKSGSNNMMISTAEGFAVNFECAPDEVFPLHPEDDMLVHANHWQSAVALTKLRETGLGEVPDSLYRDRRVRAALAARAGDIVMDDLRSAFLDDFATPFCVCRPPLIKEGGNLSATVAMILMEPGEGVMEIAPLPAVSPRFTRYELAMEAKAAERAA